MTVRNKVLVTGSSGHLGLALMLALPDLGFDPIGIDILASPLTTVVGSITDRTLVAKLLRENSISYILHAATLHKPHVESHSKQDFIVVNITGTLVLLEEAAKLESQIRGLIFFSSTTTFGGALRPGPDKPAVWIDEEVIPIPKNIYGVTKVAAEDICHLIHKQTGLPILVLRVSRFFPEDDDDPARRSSLANDNLKVVELAYRRVDIEDIVRASVCAMRSAERIKGGKYIISAPSPFQNQSDTLQALNSRSEVAFATAVPRAREVFTSKGWSFPQCLDRVYDSSKAIKDLGWQPVYTFPKVLELLAEGKDYRSPLTLQVGHRGYHSTNTGVYTVGRPAAV